MSSKLKEYLTEQRKLVYGGLHLKDNILDDITVEELKGLG